MQYVTILREKMRHSEISSVLTTTKIVFITTLPAKTIEHDHIASSYEFQPSLSLALNCSACIQDHHLR